MVESGDRKGFLEELYLSGFDRERFDGLYRNGSDPKAVRIIEQYRELIKDYPPARLEKEGALPPALLEGLKGIGIFGLNIPAEYGGAGLTLRGYLEVLEAVARTDMALALIPTAHLSIGLKGIILYGTEEQKRKYLVPAATGDMIFAYALTEPGRGSDARHVETTAALSEDGSHYVLNGRKTYITNANYAGALTVFARLDADRPGQMGAFIVETGWEGVKVAADMPKMGLKISSTAAISFKDVSVPADNLLGEPGDGFKIAMMILNYGRLGLGGASIGAMKQSLEDMLQRAASREQFDMPIASFPLVQEKIVRARVHAFAAEAMTAMTTGIFARDPLSGAALESSHTKLYGTTRAWNTLYDALQVAGGAGYLATQPYEKRMRDFRVTTVFEGTTEIHSMYPALFLLRALGKKLKAEGRGRVGTAIALMKGMLRRGDRPMNYDNALMRKAARRARFAAGRVRRMVHLALLLYGRKAAQKEFLLRRITHMSLVAFTLLSALARIGAIKAAGGDPREELHLLGYLVVETDEMSRGSRMFLDPPKERMHRLVWRDLMKRKDT